MKNGTMRLSIRYTKPRTIVKMVVNMGRGKRKTFTAVVDNLKIMRNLARQGVRVEISGLFGKIWKSVKKVAKKTGISKVISLARKALPIAAKFLPPPMNVAAAAASTAISTASDLAKAFGQRKRGTRRGRRKSAAYIQRAMRRGKAYQRLSKSRRSRRKVQRAGARMYKLMVMPS